MTRDEVQSVIVEVLREVQQISGREWKDIDRDATPIGCLDGFDSLSAVEATVMVEQKLGCKIEIDSVFVSDNGKRALTLREISERLSKLVPNEGPT
jgi:acyl carrier protein